MNALVERDELNAFIDGELELTRRLDIESRISREPQLAAQVDALRAVRNAVRTRADYHRAPEGLAAALATAARAQQEPMARMRTERAATKEGAAPRRWFAWPSLAGGLAAGVALAFALQAVLFTSTGERQLEQDVVGSHVKATLSQRLLDVESSDHHTVKPWLSSHLDYSPPVPERIDAASPLLGARIDYVGSRPVATLVYRHAGHIVDVSTWPASETKALSMAEQRGFRIAHWTSAGMAHWVVSDLNAQEFAGVVRQLQSLPSS